MDLTMDNNKQLVPIDSQENQSNIDTTLTAFIQNDKYKNRLQN